MALACRNISMMNGRLFGVCGLLLLGLGGCAIPSNPQSSAVALTQAVSDQVQDITLVIRRELPLAVAKINGQEVGFFLIDTGSSTTVVDQQIAEKLRLPTTGSMKITGIAGSLNAPVTALNHLEVGGYSFGDKRAVVVDLTKFKRSLRWPVAGILGFDSLRDRPFTLDLQAGRLRLEDARTFTPPTGSESFELRMVGGLPAVPGRIGPREAWLQIDSGSNAFLSVPVGLVRLHPQMIESDQQNRVGTSYGVGGEGWADSVHAQLDQLKVMGMELRKIPLHVESPGVTPWPIGSEGPVVGRMGNSLLKSFRLTVDYPNRKLWAQWVENR